MLNKEYYAKEIIEIVTSNNNGAIAIDLRTKELCRCSNFSCNNCLFHNPNGECSESRNKWANSEHVELIKLTPTEKIILENLDKEFKWVARDKDDRLHCFALKPLKLPNTWLSEYACICPFNQLFDFIKWEDEEPYNIEDILNNCEVIKDVD